MIKFNESRLPVIYHLIILTISMVLCGFLSVHFGKDVDYDIANYHYYNPYSFLHHRWLLDYWPASYAHVYFSPTADFLSYFLINYFSPKSAVFISGMIHGIDFWLLFQIARCFLERSRYPIAIALALAFLGMYGGVGWQAIGSFKTDHTVAIFLLSFVWLTIRSLQIYANENQITYVGIALAGLMLGLGIGLKLTVLIFPMGAVAALLLLPIQSLEKLKIVAWCGAFVLLGWLIASGYWMMFLWHQFHNPLYPYWNNFFNPSAAYSGEWHFTKENAHGIPMTWQQKLFNTFHYPFNGHTTDAGSFRDYRFLVAYVLFIVLGIRGLWSWVSKNKQQKVILAVQWLLLFFMFSYLIDLYCYFNVRYMLILEMLAPLVIYLLLNEMINSSMQKTILIGVVLYFVAFTLAPDERTVTRYPKYDGSYFNVQSPDFIKNTPDAMVLLTYPAYAMWFNPRPQSYLVPFLPQQWRYVGIPFRNNKFDADPNSAERIQETIQHYSGIFYLLAPKDSMPELIRAVGKYDLVLQGKCGDIYSDRQYVSVDVLICPVKKQLVH